MLDLVPENVCVCVLKRNTEGFGLWPIVPALPSSQRDESRTSGQHTLNCKVAELRH